MSDIKVLQAELSRILDFKISERPVIDFFNDLMQIVFDKETGTQKEIASFMGVDAATVSRWLNTKIKQPANFSYLAFMLLKFYQAAHQKTGGQLPTNYNYDLLELLEVIRDEKYIEQKNEFQYQNWADFCCKTLKLYKEQSNPSKWELSPEILKDKGRPSRTKTSNLSRSEIDYLIIQKLKQQPEKAKQLLLRLDENPKLTHLCSELPILLFLINNVDKLPQNNFELYLAILKQLLKYPELHSRDSQKIQQIYNYPTQALVSDEIVAKHVRSLENITQQIIFPANNRARSPLKSFSYDEIYDLNLPGGELEELSKFSLILNKEGDKFRFTYRHWPELLMANYLGRQDKWLTQIKPFLWLDVDWAGVIKLLAGNSKIDSNGLVENIIDAKDPFFENLKLAAYCLTEANPPSLDSQQKNQFLQPIFKALKSDKATAIEVLGVLGKYLQEDLLKLLPDENKATARSAEEALSQLKINLRLLNQLNLIANSPSKPGQEQAINVLMRIGQKLPDDSSERPKIEQTLRQIETSDELPRIKRAAKVARQGLNRHPEDDTEETTKIELPKPDKSANWAELNETVSSLENLLNLLEATEGAEAELLELETQLRRVKTLFDIPQAEKEASGYTQIINEAFGRATELAAEFNRPEATREVKKTCTRIIELAAREYEAALESLIEALSSSSSSVSAQARYSLLQLIDQAAHPIEFDSNSGEKAITICEKLLDKWETTTPKGRKTLYKALHEIAPATLKYFSPHSETVLELRNRLWQTTLDQIDT